MKKLNFWYVFAAIATLMLLLLSAPWINAQTLGKQPVDILKTVSPFDVLYRAKSDRDLTLFPLTTKGRQDMEKAASMGQLDLTVTCPNGTQVLIPKGTRPPLVPPCNNTIQVTTSTIGLAARYKYSTAYGGELIVQADGIDGVNYTMKIVPVNSSVTFNLSNQNNPHLYQNTAYPPGQNIVTDSYNLDWSLRGVTPGVPITQIFTKDNVSFSVTYTPQVTTVPQQLFIAANTSPPVNNTVTPPVSGGTLAGGYGEGSFAQMVVLAPFVPTTNQLSSWPQGNTSQYITSSDGTKAGFLKSVGGALTHLSEPGGENLINTFDDGNNIPFEGAHAPNRGRSAGPSTYGSPNGANLYPFCQNNQCTSRGPGDDDTGWNPVVGGDRFNNSPIMLWYERKTVNGVEWIYIRSQPLQWSLNNVPAEQINHMWYGFESGKAVTFFYIIENTRTDTQMKFIGRQQELPFAYLEAPAYRYYIYSGNDPGTNGGLQQINKGQPCEGSNGSCNQNDTGDFISTEYWIGGVKENNHGVFLVTPYTAQVGGKQFQGWSGNEFSNASAYINSKVQTNFDIPGCTAWRGKFYVGEISSFRAWLSSNPVQKMPFSFTFAAGKTAGWYGEDAATKFEGNNQYTFSIGQKNQDGNSGGSFCSPWGAWRVADIGNRIYIKAKANVNTINVQFIRPGESDIQMEQYNNKQVQVINDGQEHTYAVDMPWSGVIARVKIKLPYPYPSMSGNEKFVPTYIGTINPN